jgi:hypothetical protein
MSSMMWFDEIPGEPKNPDRAGQRLISLPKTIAPVVSSPPRLRRRPRRILSLSSAGTLASLAIVTRETIGHVTHLLRRFG